MDVDLGVGLGDDLGGFEGFDELFSNPNPSDIFKFCAIEEGGAPHEARAPLTMTPLTSESASEITNQLGLGEYSSGYEDWNRGRPREIPKSDVTHGAVMYPTGKPRARKRHDEDEALESTEVVPPILKVCSLLIVLMSRELRFQKLEAILLKKFVATPSSVLIFEFFLERHVASGSFTAA